MMLSKFPQTTLSLLTRDGAVTVTFSAKLTDEQYARLFELTRCAETKLDMEAILASVAADWEVPAVIEDA
jgi:hypothetical protein